MRFAFEGFEVSRLMAYLLHTPLLKTARAVAKSDKEFSDDILSAGKEPLLKARRVKWQQKETKETKRHLRKL
jgi:hypothetical protein